MSSVILEPFKITDQAELLVISEEIFFFSSGVSSAASGLCLWSGQCWVESRSHQLHRSCVYVYLFKYGSLAHIAGGVPELPPLVS